MSCLRILLQRLALATTLLVGIAQAHAQAPGSPKVSADLRAVLAAPAATPVPWARQLSNQQWYVKVLINASSTDPNLSALRADILVRGGSVFYNFLSVRALSALVPVNALDALAARSDVIGIAPNRSTTRHASLLQQASGANTQLPLGAGGLAQPGLDGRGVGIAVLDSGIDYRHQHTFDPSGRTRVRVAVDIVKIGRELFGSGWSLGRDWSPSLRVAIDGSKFKHELKKLAPNSNDPDPYGHGSHVAAVAAGAGNYQSPESGGIAPGTDLFDVRVLDERGVGNLADVLAGIDWTMQRARQANIRVVNLSLGASSTDSFLVDPLARATRSATAMGLVVVAAAGNAGRNTAGQTVYGTVSSPGHEPSVITVGAANLFASAARGDDRVTGFSSRGPSRGSFVYPSGRRWIDNLVKPDLVAPGNRLVAALGADAGGQAAGWNFLARTYPQLAQVPGATQQARRTLMELSGSSVAAPAVAGAVALMLQANPGLTPPLVKAILQYSAQPLPNASLVEQGTGLLNVEGAVRMAQALRTDLAPALAAGTLRAGDNLLAPGKVLPAAQSMLNGQPVAWSRMAVAGGSHLVGGEALFTRWQPIYDPALTWARQVALRSTVSWLPAGGGVAAQTVPASVVETNAPATSGST